MKGMSKAAAAAAAVLLSAGMMSLHAGAAGTIEDVYAALREIGAPDGFISRCRISMISPSTMSSA